MCFISAGFTCEGFYRVSFIAASFATHLMFYGIENVIEAILPPSSPF